MISTENIIIIFIILSTFCLSNIMLLHVISVGSDSSLSAYDHTYSIFCFCHDMTSEHEILPPFYLNSGSFFIPLFIFHSPSLPHFFLPDIILSLFFSVPFSHLFSLIYSNAATTLFYFSTLSSSLPPSISTVSDDSSLTLDSCYPLFSLLHFLYGFNFFCDHLTFYCIVSTFYQSNQKALRALLEAAKVSEERVDQAIIENKGTAQ